MSIVTIAQIVFFLALGINTFWPFPYASPIIGIAAIVAGIALIIGKQQRSL